MPTPPEKPTYSEYLQLDRVLNSQAPYSEMLGKSAHDETLFIVVHQTYELWFKQILHDLDSVLAMFRADFVDEKNIGVAVARLQRIVQIEKLMIEQIKVLETMTPLDFLEFRNVLTGASGFQSVQFRIIENKLGLLPSQRLKYANRDYHAEYNDAQRSEVLQSENQSTLFSVVEKWLERTPFLKWEGYNFIESYKHAFERMLESERQSISNTSSLSGEEKKIRLEMIKQTQEYVHSVIERESYTTLKTEGKIRLNYDACMAALFINLYRDQPILHLPFKLLSQVLEIDEYLSLWRYRHSLMVLRMIGAKMGTGGSSGHDYLKATIEKHRIFLDLFNLSTLLLPRSEIPELSPELLKQLSFSFSSRGDKKA